ncbi:MAG: DNA-deoxyinosine glycosylase [Burkholderiaceae bacterium]|nr:DNA-deoxyinosine glycosylase [Burkholderiaceae bacterium]
MPQIFPYASARLHGLPPVVSEHTVVLILGSFPGAASLRAQQYYAHPQNHFWKILQALWPQHLVPVDGPCIYAARCEWLLARGLGVWDVYESCERAGSLDTSIRNAQVNDFARLRGRCPQLAAIAHNGGESFKHASAVLHSLCPPAHAPCLCPLPASSALQVASAAVNTAAVNSAAGVSALQNAQRVTAIRLPSTSPANASWSFERKLNAWAALMVAHGLL